MTGDGQLDVAHSGPRCRRSSTPAPAIRVTSTASRSALAAGRWPGAGHARARRSRVGRAGARASAWPARRFLEDAVAASATRSGRSPGQPLADGDVIAAGDTSLVAVHTPGHAPDHLCFWHEATRTLFCGDLAFKGTTVWIPAQPGRRPGGLPRVARARARARAGAAAAGARAGHRRSGALLRDYIDASPRARGAGDRGAARGRLARRRRSSRASTRGLKRVARAAGARERDSRTCSSWSATGVRADDRRRVAYH